MNENNYPSPHEGQRILVVDDAADTRLILNLRLQREGYTVYTAEGGREALETSRREGLPNVVLEAMACGLPCVAADVSGTRELIKPGDTGYTYPPDDVSALATAVTEALSPDGRRLGANGRRVTEQLFSLEAVAGNYCRLYGDLLGTEQ